MASVTTQARQTPAARNGHGGEPEEVRCQVNLPEEIYRRFKAQCILERTTIAKEVRRLIEARIEAGDPELSEMLYVRVSPQLKAELMSYAAGRKRTLAEVLLDGFGMLRRARPAKEPEEAEIPAHAARARNGVA